MERFWSRKRVLCVFSTVLEASRADVLFWFAVGDAEVYHAGMVHIPGILQY
jgi:hypothetical protein